MTWKALVKLAVKQVVFLCSFLPIYIYIYIYIYVILLFFGFIQLFLKRIPINACTIFVSIQRWSNSKIFLKTYLPNYIYVYINYYYFDYYYHHSYYFISITIIIKLYWKQNMRYRQSSLYIYTYIHIYIYIYIYMHVLWIKPTKLISCYNFQQQIVLK